MSNKKDGFKKEIGSAYEFEGPSLMLGTAMIEGEPIAETLVRIPLEMLNRHGMISGATGTGKTKTAQILAEQLSEAGVPSLIMDMKSDLSGIAVPGTNNKHIEWRHGLIGEEWKASGSPVEFLSLSKEPGIRLRSTVTEFGPILLSKIMGLNDTQQSVLTILFKYCDDHNIPLLDLEDLKDILRFSTQEGKEKLQAEYGYVAPATIGAIMRRVVELEHQKADELFGEPSFEVKDLCRHNQEGKGVVNVIRLKDIQTKPKLFSTFMLQLLAEVYATFPEEGDLERPKLCIFIDEAHLVFQEASSALLDQIEMIVKLIRSKGVGLFFITQNPVDVPSAVLSQLGMKVQHALRAFTAKDRKAIKLVSENYPITDYYDVEKELTELGIGEALFTTLDEKGRPSPLVRTLLRAPQSRMDVLEDEELESFVKGSSLRSKYEQKLEKKEAQDVVKEKIEHAHQEEVQKELKRIDEQVHEEKQGSSWLDILGDAMNSTAGKRLSNTIAREVTRGLFGILGKKR